MLWPPPPGLNLLRFRLFTTMKTMPSASRAATRRGNIELPSSLVFWPSSSAPEKNGLEVGLGVVKGLKEGVGEGEGDGVGERLASGTE